MVLKNMIALCKKSNTITMFGDKQNGKWLTDGYTCAYLGDDCELTKEDILYIMELDEDKKECMRLTDMPMPEMLIKGINGTIEKIERCRFTINCDGMALQPFATSKGALFLDTKLMQIFKDVNGKEYYFDDNMVFVRANGETIGVIAPCRTDLETMYNFSSNLTELVWKAKNNEFFDSGYHQYSVLDDEQ